MMKYDHIILYLQLPQLVSYRTSLSTSVCPPDPAVWLHPSYPLQSVKKTVHCN